MTDYAILSWLTDDATASAPLAAARTELTRQGWKTAAQQPGLEVWVPTRDPPLLYLSPVGDGLIIGAVFGQPEGAWGPDPLATASALCRAVWGRYLAVFRQPGGRAQAMFRDPSGGVEALTWRAGGLSLIASDAANLLEAVPPIDLAIDWDRLGAALADPIALAGACPLLGVTTVCPGGLRNLDDGGETLVWTPGAFARDALGDTPETRRAIVDTLDRVVSALAKPGGRAVAELSGGLDSSIVASALVRAPGIKVAQWIHYFVEDAGGDERSYARAAAHKLGVDLAEVSKATHGIRLDALAVAAGAIRPSGAVADAHYDQDMAERCRALGAEQIFTGLGGDTVFMQGGTPLLAADDYWRRPIWRASLRPALDVARHANRSVWSVWRQAQVARFNPSPKPYAMEVGHLSAKARAAKGAGGLHPWLADLEGVAPAKRRQVMHLAHQLLVVGRTARGQQAQIVNPLLSQPVMELCLRLSTRALTAGGDDRSFARQAFRDRLAPEVFARRSKGDLGRHYGRAIAEDLEAVRELLMEGALARAGLIDTEALDVMLTPENLIWRGPYREIVSMVVLEQWARSWGERLARLRRTVSAERQVQPV